MARIHGDGFAVGPIVLLVAFPALPGCLPFALPPAEVSVGAGGAWGNIVASRMGQRVERTETAVVQVRVEEDPLHFFRSQFKRRYDVGVGYVGELYRPAASPFFGKHGAYVKLGFHPWMFVVPRGPAKGALLRVVVYGLGELLAGDSGYGVEAGGGATGGVMFKLADFSRGKFVGGQCAGWAFGEKAFGIYAQAGYRHIHHRPYWVATAGVVATLPAAYGVCFR